MNWKQSIEVSLYLPVKAAITMGKIPVDDFDNRRCPWHHHHRHHHHHQRIGRKSDVRTSNWTAQNGSKSLHVGSDNDDLILIFWGRKQTALDCQTKQLKPTNYRSARIIRCGGAKIDGTPLQLKTLGRIRSNCLRKPLRRILSGASGDFWISSQKPR